MKHTINKQLIATFYQKVITEHDLIYAKSIVAKNYIQHNPQLKTGRDGFLEAIAFLKKLPKPKNPPKPFMRLLSDNDYVIAHFTVEFSGQKKIVLDVFRIENDLIAEHWDAIQEKSETSLNGNSEIKGAIQIEDHADTLLNKKIVETFTNQVLVAQKFEQIPVFVDDTIIQHNPKIKSGTQGIVEYYQTIKIKKVYKVLGEGNFVVTQSKAIINNEDFVLYDLYRLYQERIVEQWSVSQKIPKTMAHANGMI